jgi:hypothetical protein
VEEACQDSPFEDGPFEGGPFKGKCGGAFKDLVTILAVGEGAFES